MLIPYATVRRKTSLPWANWSIAALNIIVYCYILGLGREGFVAFVERWALRADHPERVWTWFTMMWLHDPSVPLHLHLIGNLWALLVFGPQVEDALGALRYTLLYVGGGLFACLAHVVMSLAAGVEEAFPTLGASGAVMGVLGLFAVRFYSTPVKALLFVIPGVRLPAVVFLAIYIGLSDVRPGLIASFAEGEASGVAHWAHIGGFLGGALLGALTGGVRSGKREYLVERPVDSKDERSARMRELREHLAATAEDAEAHLRLATLLDGDSRTLTLAPRHYAQAIRQLVLEGELTRVCAAYDAFCEGGHSFDELDPEVSGFVAAAYERLGRKDAALYIYHHLATRSGVPARLTEQALARTASLGIELADRERARWALDRLEEDFPMSAWTEWAVRQRAEHGLSREDWLD